MIIKQLIFTLTAMVFPPTQFCINFRRTKYVIEDKFALYTFNFANKAGKSKIKEIEISIPILLNGDFDLIAQQEIAEKYRKIEEIKKALVLEMEKIQNIEIDLE